MVEHRNRRSSTKPYHARAQGNGPGVSSCHGSAKPLLIFPNMPSSRCGQGREHRPGRETTQTFRRCGPRPRSCGVHRLSLSRARCSPWRGAGRGEDAATRVLSNPPWGGAAAVTMGQGGETILPGLGQQATDVTNREGQESHAVGHGETSSRESGPGHVRVAAISCST